MTTNKRSKAWKDPSLVYTLDAMDFFHEYGGDPLKPSLFELVAQEQLGDLLQPALKYVLSVWLTTITGRTAEP